jgi:hypothetical protein
MSLRINDGRSTVDPVANPLTNCNSRVGVGYTVTLTLHSTALSSSGNKDVGSVVYRFRWFYNERNHNTLDHAKSFASYINRKHGGGKSTITAVCEQGAHDSSGVCDSNQLASSLSWFRETLMV